MQYVILLTTQNTWGRVSGGDGPGRLEPLRVDDQDGLKHIARTSPETINIELSMEDEALHLWQLKEACRLSSLAVSPRLEYRLMLEAYHARQNSDYRKAIIEAATALEICLTNRALKEFSAQGISFGEQLLQKKFRMLGGRLEVVRLLGIPLPEKDYVRLIVNPHNEVIHQADFPSKALCNQVIAEVEKLLGLFSPQLNEDVKNVKNY